MGVTFQKRRLRFSFFLANGVFDKEGEPDAVEIVDFRSKAEVLHSGGFDFATIRGQIYGLDQETMDRLTIIYDGVTLESGKNVVRVEATDSEGAFSTIFTGEILHCIPMYNNAPDVFMEFSARAGVIGRLSPVFPRSFPGPRFVADIVRGIAVQLGYEFKNNGVQGVLVDQALAGTAIDMLNTIKEAANISVYIDTASNTLSITPVGQPLESEPVLVSQETGLIGWPVRQQVGVEFTMLYTPDIHIGCKIKMESDYAICNGDWYINRAALNLSCNMPGGPWFSEFYASKAKLSTAR